MDDDYKFIDLSDYLEKASFDDHLDDINNEKQELDDNAATMIRSEIEKFCFLIKSNDISYFNTYINMFIDSVQSFGKEIAEVLITNNLIQTVYPLYTRLNHSNKYVFHILIFKLLQRCPILLYDTDDTLPFFLLDSLNTDTESRTILVALHSLMCLFNSKIPELYSDEILSQLHIIFKSLHLYRPSDDPEFCEIEQFNDDIDKFCRLNVHISFLNCFSAISIGPQTNYIEAFIEIIAESYQSRVLQIAETAFSGLCTASEKYPKCVQDILTANHFTRFLSVPKCTNTPHSIVSNIILIQARLSFLFDENVLSKMQRNNVWFLVENYIDSPDLFRYICAILSNCMLLDHGFCQATLSKGFVQRIFEMFSPELPMNDKDAYAILFGSIMKHSLTETYSEFISTPELIESVAFSLDHLRHKNLIYVLQGFIRLMRYQHENSEEPTVAQILAESEIFSWDTPLHDKSKSVSCLVGKIIRLINASIDPE